MLDPNLYPTDDPIIFSYIVYTEPDRVEVDVDIDLAVDVNVSEVFNY